jgi:hypothetical protein
VQGRGFARWRWWSGASLGRDLPAHQPGVHFAKGRIGDPSPPPPSRAHARAASHTAATHPPPPLRPSSPLSFGGMQAGAAPCMPPPATLSGECTSLLRGRAMHGRVCSRARRSSCACVQSTRSAEGCASVAPSLSVCLGRWRWNVGGIPRRVQIQPSHADRPAVTAAAKQLAGCAGS